MNISVSSLELNVANFRMQALSSLMGSDADSTNLFMAAISGQLPATGNVKADSWLGSVTADRNMGLNDPGAAYDMMTVINNKDVLYKAQFSELSRMKDAISAVQQAAQKLDIAVDTDNASIQSQLQGFVDQYNSWGKQFSQDMQQGGLLADTQAAQVARRELDQSIKYIFNGAKDGIHGLADLGITIDRTTGLAAFDTAKLDKMLSSNKQGVVDAVDEFSANFAEAARLLNSDGNFMPRQLDNLSRAIHFIDDNTASLQAEFGTGDAAKPTGSVAQALAVYNKIYGS